MSECTGQPIEKVTSSPQTIVHDALPAEHVCKLICSPLEMPQGDAPANTGSAPQIDEDTDRDRYMSPLEAKQYGLIDQVIGGDDAGFKASRYPPPLNTSERLEHLTACDV